MSQSSGPSTDPAEPAGLRPSDDVLAGGRDRERWRWRWRPGTRGVVALTLALLVAGAAWAVHDGSTGTRPAPSSSTATPAPPRQGSGEPGTTVSVGRVTIPTHSVEEQLSLVSGLLRGADVDARYRPLPDGTGGVRVQFDRRLAAPSAAAFRSALAGLPGASVDLADVPAFTVDVTVPAAAGYTCVPAFFQPQAVLDEPDLAVVDDVLGIYGLGFSRGSVTLSYTGPAVSDPDLQAVRVALAHSCGTSPDQVTLLRHLDGG